MKRLTHATLLGLALSLAACGGGAGGSAALPSPNQNSAGTPANARILITIPAKAASSSRGSKPAYVSPATQSITVQVDSGTATAQNLSPTSPNCSVSGPLGSLTCAVPIATAAGAHTITFTTYDQPGAAGNKLSTNSVAATIVANQLNTINATLAGIPASIQATAAASSIALTGSLLSGFTFVAGAPPLVIAALDADGNFIVGPGAPALAVTVSGATAGAGIAVAASGSNPNEFTLSATGMGTATLSISATPAASIAGNPLAVTTPLTTSVLTTTIAGNVAGGFADGTGTAAAFNAPAGIAYDAGNGDLYLTDTYNCAIRQTTPAGVVTTLAGSPTCGTADGTGAGAQFSSPGGIAYDSSNGDLYVTDTYNCTIRQVTSGGAVTTFAGAGPPCSSSADGTGTAAQFNFPHGIAYDPTNNDLYVTDMENCTIRQVTASGVVTTIAGAPGACGFADGTGSSAHFGYPQGIAYAANGDLYITDTNNCRIRQMTTAGVVTTIAGGTCGFADGSGSSAQFKSPQFLAYDSSDGNLYVTDTNNNLIRRVTLAGTVTTFAGPAGLAYGGNLDGLFATAMFSSPQGIAYDAANGSLYVTDTSNSSIREIIQP